MKPAVLSFHHPVAFWVGCVAVVAGVFAHLPMFLMGRAMHWQLVGMPMTPLMLAGMALIPVGLLLSTFGLMPRLEQVRRTLHDSSHLHFHIADGVPLNREHWKLVVVLVVALAIDVMKPATLGFVVPGMSAEYVIPKPTASLLALVALIGTTVGSVVWGRMADVFGRRAAILLSALMFMGTAICGAMPAFGWNLVMCFLMGASAGGLLPITFTLMAETIPAAHRGWLLVALGGVGTSAGYLLAAGSASLLEPMFSWRVLWLLGLPTGAIILFLNRFIPESPRFLSNAGYEREARAVLRKFAGDSASDAIETDDAQHPGAPVIDERHPVVGMRQLLRGRHARITWGLVMGGVAWGLVNFGFVLWLPVNLAGMGVEAAGVSSLLARSAILALPGIGVVIWLYHRWSSFKSLVLFIGLTTAALLVFFAMGSGGVQSQAVTMAATVALLVSVSGVIAMLIPYAAEIYPVHLRGTGSGVIAASSKFGGILGAGLGVLGFFGNFALSALLIAVPMALSGVMLWRSGIETRGQGLEDIQDALGTRDR